MPNNSRTRYQMGAAVEKLISAWLNYARAYEEHHDSPIGDDSYAEAEWTDIGRSILGLSNLEIGDLNAATIDSYIRNVAEKNNSNIP